MFLHRGDVSGLCLPANMYALPLCQPQTNLSPFAISRLLVSNSGGVTQLGFAISHHCYPATTQSYVAGCPLLHKLVITLLSPMLGYAGSSR